MTGIDQEPRLNPDVSIMATLDGIRDTIDRMTEDMSRYWRAYSAASTLARAAFSEEDQVPLGSPLFDEAFQVENLSTARKNAEDIYAIRYAGTATEIVELCGRARGTDARVRGFRTAAYLFFSRRHGQAPPIGTELVDVWPASLARAGVGDPVLLMESGTRPDYSVFWGGSVTSDRLELKYEPVSPSRAFNELLLTGEARKLEPDTRALVDLRIDLGRGSYRNYDTVAIGSEAIAAKIRPLLDGGMGAISHSALLCELSDTGRSLTEFGITAEDLTRARALYGAQLAKIQGIEQRNQDGKPVGVGIVLAIQKALAAIDAAEQTHHAEA